MKVRSGWTGPEGNFVGVSGKVNLDLTPVLESGVRGFGGTTGIGFGPDFAKVEVGGPPLKNKFLGDKPCSVQRVGRKIVLQLHSSHSLL